MFRLTKHKCMQMVCLTCKSPETHDGAMYIGIRTIAELLTKEL